MFGDRGVREGTMNEQFQEFIPLRVSSKFTAKVNCIQFRSIRWKSRLLIQRRTSFYFIKGISVMVKTFWNLT